MNTPTNTMLMSMAVCDLLTIVPPAPWYDIKEYGYNPISISFLGISISTHLEDMQL